MIHQPEWFAPFALRYQLVDDRYRVTSFAMRFVEFDLLPLF
jgi:hypothetical protein